MPKPFWRQIYRSAKERGTISHPKKFFSHPGLQLSQAFPLPFPAERTTHPLVLVLPSTYLQLLSPPLVLHEALPALQAAAEAPDPAPKLAFFAHFSRPIPFPVGQGVGMCVLTLEQILCMGRFCMGHLRGSSVSCVLPVRILLVMICCQKAITTSAGLHTVSQSGHKAGTLAGPV